MVMFLLFWSLKNRNEPFYSALKTKWSVLRKALLPLGCWLADSPVCASALTQARQAAGSESFEKLLKVGNKKHLLVHDTLLKLKGYRLYAVDGSSMNLHSNRKLEAAFGRPTSTGEAKSLPQASFTALILVNTGWIVDYQIGRHDASELDQTKKLSEQLGKGDLLIGDRLMFDTEWFSKLCARQVKFLFRVTSNRYKSFTEECIKTIDAARKSGNVDCIVNLKIKGETKKTIKVRYIEIQRENQETLRFITNLSAEEFSIREIAVLYRMRWEIETDFRFFKGQDHCPVIISRTEETVRQEILSRVLAHNTVRFTQAAACVQMNQNAPKKPVEADRPSEVLERKNAEETWQTKSAVWLNLPRRPVDLQFNTSVALISAYIIDAAVFPDEELDNKWKRLLDDIAKAEIRVLDGRSFKRKGRKHNKGKRCKGNSKAQRQSRKKRRQVPDT